MKTLKAIKKELMKDMVSRGWNHTFYCDVAEFFGRFIEKHFYEVKAVKKVKGSKPYYETCPKCERTRARYRLLTKDYMCRLCKHVFKKHSGEEDEE